jgi:hypothetical protein
MQPAQGDCRGGAPAVRAEAGRTALGRLLAACCLAASLSASAEIYRWTDEAGRVHYGERPPGDGAEPVVVRPSPAGGAAAPSEAQRRERQQRLLESFEYERARRAEQRAEAARLADRRARDCRQVQAILRRLDHAGPVYVTDADGSRRYLDDAERAAEKARLEPTYERACGGSSD